MCVINKHKDLTSIKLIAHNPNWEFE